MSQSPLSERGSAAGARDLARWCAGAAGHLARCAGPRMGRDGGGMQVVYPRCAAIDVARKEIAVCVRTPGEAPGERHKHRRPEVRKWAKYDS